MAGEESGVGDAILFLPFTEAAAGATPDVAGGRSALLRGGAALGPGREGTGLALPGSGAFLELAHDPAFALAEGALSFWIRPDAIGAAQGLAGKDADGIGAGEMTLLLRADGRVSFLMQSESKTFQAISARALAPGEWVHVEASWGPGGMRLRLDGVLDGASAHTGGLVGNAEPWVIGANASRSADLSSAGLRDFFRGGIDEVALRGAAAPPPPDPAPDPGPAPDPDPAPPPGPAPEPILPGAGGPLLGFANTTRAKVVDLERGYWADAPRVLPLGDSNTLGLSNVLPSGAFESYRAALWGHVTGERFWIDYVGGRSNGPASLQDRAHQGVSGIRATTVVDQATQIATNRQPDVVLMMLGTNDALNEADAAATVPGELLAIMRAIDAVRPDAAILIAPLPPIDPDAPGFARRADADAIRDAINARLPDIAAQARAEGIDARFVPMPDLGRGDLYDGVHLTAAGHAKIAAAWAAAMADGLAGGAYDGPRTATAGVREVRGSEAGDFLRGDAGDNRLIGRGGADRIEGGPGADVMTGGAGADVFVWRAPEEGGDRITDFSAADFLEFSAAGFGGGLVAGAAPVLRAGAAAPQPQGGAGQFLYGAGDGRLSWDPDGAGPAPAVLIATLTGAPALGAGDFLIV